MLKFYYVRFKVLIKKLIGRPISLEQLAFVYLKPDYVVLEAGANDGHDTKRLAHATSKSVFAFEPVPALFDKLKQNAAAQKNIIVSSDALGDTCMKLPMYISGGESDGSSSLLKPKEHLNKNPEVNFNETIMVNVTTLDKWALENNVKKIDFMWLDMQGHEFSMLKASKIILPTLKVLYTEVSTEELYTGQCIYADYKQWLLSIGFKLIKEDLPWGFTGNALFAR